MKYHVGLPKMGKQKEKIEFWGKDTGKEVVKATWKGAKTVGLIVVAAAAIGLGLGAMDGASG